jgi:hypothetical protein
MAHSTRQAQCRLTAFGEVVLTFPYRASLVADLKDEVPYRYRAFDKTLKTWTVWGGYEDVAVSLLLAHFPDADVPLRWRPHQRSGTGTTASALISVEPCRTLHLAPSAPAGLIDAAYRWWAKQLHPDHGGDGEAMRRVNAAYLVLKDRVPA